MNSYTVQCLMKFSIKYGHYLKEGPVCFLILFLCNNWTNFQTIWSKLFIEPFNVKGKEMTEMCDDLINWGLEKKTLEQYIISGINVFHRYLFTFHKLFCFSVNKHTYIIYMYICICICICICMYIQIPEDGFWCERSSVLSHASAAEFSLELLLQNHAASVISICSLIEHISIWR